MIYWQLILVYLKIGMFGFGGGYAMLSLIQYEVVDHHHWLTLQQFTDVVAIGKSSVSCPLKPSDSAPLC